MLEEELEEYTIDDLLFDWGVPEEEQGDDEWQPAWMHED